MQESKLSKFFNQAGDVVEAMGPSIYRFLASILPYLTPIPVAWLTMKSAETFFQFTPGISFVFVFALEGIGLWFTGLFVESVVDAIRSRNGKSVIMVFIFGFVVAAYVFILVRLNVTLKTALEGSANPQLSQVVTLLCFLPLMSGVGNGYYKVSLEAKRDRKLTTEQERMDRKEKHREKLLHEERKLMIERGMLPEGSTNVLPAGGNFPRTFQQVSNVSTNVPAEMKKVLETFQNYSTDWRKFSPYLSKEEVRYLANMTPDEMKILSNATGLSYKSLSNYRARAQQIV